jgi:hypothetical protein
MNTRQLFAATSVGVMMVSVIMTSPLEAQELYICGDLIDT